MAINSCKGNKRAYSINPRGGYYHLSLQFDQDTEVYQSCSLQWKNHYYVFGGNLGKSGGQRHVSMLNGNRLGRKGTLIFDFSYGACTVLNQLNIVLCFGKHGEYNVCRESNNPLGLFTKLPKSAKYHRQTRIASFDGKNTIY